LNVATPFTAAAVAVPESAPLPGLVPIARVILSVALVTVFPDASCTVTCTVIGAFEAMLEGWPVKASLVAAGGGGAEVSLHADTARTAMEASTKAPRRTVGF